MNSNKFKGSVKFAKFGYQKITKYFERSHGFSINTKGKLGPVESIGFNQLKVTEEKIEGRYIFNRSFN